MSLTRLDDIAGMNTRKELRRQTAAHLARGRVILDKLKDMNDGRSEKTGAGNNRPAVGDKPGNSSSIS